MDLKNRRENDTTDSRERGVYRCRWNQRDIQSRDLHVTDISIVFENYITSLFQYHSAPKKG
jgi:hypothetical protein